MTERQKEIFTLLNILREKYSITDAWVAKSIGISKQMFFGQVNKVKEMDKDVYDKAKELLLNYESKYLGRSNVKLDTGKGNYISEKLEDYNKKIEKLEKENNKYEDLIEGLSKSQKILSDRIDQLEKENKRITAELRNKESELEDKNEAIETLQVQFANIAGITEIVKFLKSWRLK